MLLSHDRRVVPVPALAGFRGTGSYATANPGGPAGSALMTFFAVFMAQRLPGTATTFENIFGRNNAGPAGWGIYFSTTNLLRFSAANATPAAVNVNTSVVLQTPMVAIARYTNGTLDAWVNGVLVGTTTLGAGYTAHANATFIGNFQGGVDPARNCTIAECGMLNGFDIAATVATTTAQWQEDLQQGRDLTWPQTPDAQNDWYWSARDAVLGRDARATWTDRIQGAIMTRTGAPQGGQIMPRF